MYFDRIYCNSKLLLKIEDLDDFTPSGLLTNGVTSQKT